MPVLRAQRPRQAVFEAEIIDAVWRARFAGESVLPRAIVTLRWLIGDDARDSHLIETTAKRDYRLIAPVISLPRPPMLRPSLNEPCPSAGLEPASARRSAAALGPRRGCWDNLQIGSRDPDRR